jgi:inner membrane protein
MIPRSVDPLTHTFVGATLADGLGGRRSRLAAATLLIGANLPDIDVLAYAWGGDTALFFRRGWTHGLLAMLVLPLLLGLAMATLDRWRQIRRNLPYPASRAGWLIGLSYLAALTHPLLDWFNTYGVRLLMPFSGRWFYGDAIFIIDPWLWLLMGGTLFLTHSRSPRSLSLWSVLGILTTLLVFAGTTGATWARPTWLFAIAALVVLRWRRGRLRRDAIPYSVQTSRLVLTAVALYAACMISLSLYAERMVAAVLADPGDPPAARFMVGPLPVDPLGRAVVIESEGSIRRGSFHLLRRPELEISDESLPVYSSATLQGETLVSAATAAPCVRGMVNWMRFPFYEIESEANRHTVRLLDARYVGPGSRGFGTATVHLEREEEGEPLVAGCGLEP